MGRDSGIQWTHHTLNPWWGCIAISPACKNCYAESFDKRTGGDHWGVNSRRRFFGDKHWNEPLKWNREAEKEGVRRRVFCASMADVFERLPAEHPDATRMDAERARLWTLIEKTPHLDWLLLTKRPENVMAMVPERWRNAFPVNVWMGTTVEDQENADKRIPHLLRIPARVRFLSCEPLLEEVKIKYWTLEDVATVGTWMNAEQIFAPQPPIGLHWVILGGESSAKARPMDLEWVRFMLRRCKAVGAAVFVKQLGERWARATHGRSLKRFDTHGGTPEDGWPDDLIVREFPT